MTSRARPPNWLTFLVSLVEALKAGDAIPLMPGACWHPASSRCGDFLAVFGSKSTTPTATSLRSSKETFTMRGRRTASQMKMARTPLSK